VIFDLLALDGEPAMAGKRGGGEQPALPVEHCHVVRVDASNYAA
jgi:hypothetical protein